MPNPPRNLLSDRRLVPPGMSVQIVSSGNGPRLQRVVPRPLDPRADNPLDAILNRLGVYGRKVNAADLSDSE
jgi:hypothetical protein